MNRLYDMILTKAGALTVCLTLLTACTDYVTPPPVAEGGKQSEGVQDVKKYVLWVNIEGAGGGELVKRALPKDGAIMGLLPHSIYMWNGLEAEHENESNPVIKGQENPIASTSILTGNIPYRHKISNYSYISEEAFIPGNTEALKSYTSFFQYISDYDSKMPTVAITPWKLQNEKLLFDAMTNITTATDEETLEKALNRIEEENDRVIYLSFKDVLTAASSGGWKEDNEMYKTAMQKTDGYVGQLLEALNARELAYFEDWLVIVTSNHGGKPDGTYGGDTPEERNMFGIFYFPHFSKGGEKQGETLELLRLDEKFQGVVIDSVSQARFNPGLTEDINRQVYSIDTLEGRTTGMTIQMIMAVRPSKKRSYVTDATLWDKGGSGFNLYLTGYYNTYVGGRCFGEDFRKDAKFNDFADPLFHSVSVAVELTKRDWREKKEDKIDEFGVKTPVWSDKKDVNFTNRVVHYDGAVRVEDTMTKTYDRKNCTNNSNLVFGTHAWSCRYIAEIRVWNRRIENDALTKYANTLKLTPANCEDYDHLTGYWMFYKGENDEYLKDDSLVVNQVAQITKPDGSVVKGEPIRLRKKKSDGKFTPITAEDVKYVVVPNTMPQHIKEGKRMMESTMVVPAILNWIGAEYPTERATRSTVSKLDGMRYGYDSEAGQEIWKDLILGSYEDDLEWRDKSGEQK